MYKITVFVGLAAAAAAWGADCVVERAATPTGAPEPAGTDGTLELKWDSGFGRWWMCWYTGRDYWVGNDFDVSTISGYRTVQTIKLQARSNWPNIGWEGFRLGIYNFAGSVPGSLLWGPKFVVPTGASGWKEFSVGWTLPTGTYKFLAGQEQYYDYPNCEAFLIDNNPTFLGHSWQYLRTRWEPFEQSSVLPYRNLMIRVVVNDSTSVKPNSVGRVKALYY